ALGDPERICAGPVPRRFVPLVVIPATVRNAFIAAEEPQLSRYIAGCIVSQAYAETGALERQIRTSLLAHRIARDVSRDRILEVYLNEVLLGRGAFGIAAAADTYLGKAVSDWSVAESASMAAMARAPGQRRTERRNFVIDRMAEVGAISAAQAAEAKLQP